MRLLPQLGDSASDIPLKSVSLGADGWRGGSEGRGGVVTASVAAVRGSGLLDSFRRSFREGPGLVVWPVAAAGVVVFGLAVSAGVGWLAGPAVALLIAATL